MILFAEDLAHYPTAIVDTQTSNQSFVRLAALYKEMGVKNHSFILTLIDPDLQGVDPRDPFLDVATKAKIVYEASINIWYFLREIIRIPPIAGPDAIAYIANRGNIALTWCFLNHIDIILIQPRQTGKSVGTDCIMIWLLFLASRNTRINMVTLSEKLRTANVERLKKMRDLLPKYFYIQDRSDARNNEKITYNKFSNSYVTNVGQSSESGALGVGRGTTSPIAHIDEPPFISHIGTLIPAALAAGNAAREEARMKGEPYGTILTTTAGKRDDRDGKYIYDMLTDGWFWNEHVYDQKDERAARRFIRKNSNGDDVIVNATFSHRQLGKTDAWLFESMRANKSKGDDANRDFFNIWTSGTQRSPLSIHLNEVVKNSEKEPTWVEISEEGYAINWYRSKEEIENMRKNGWMAIGMDTSEAIGRDGIGMVLVDLTDLSVVGAGTFNETNLLTYARWLGEFLIKYKQTILVIENKSTGQMIIDCLNIELPRHGEDPFRRIFNHVVQDADESKTKGDEFKEISSEGFDRPSEVYTYYKRDFGFMTTGNTRHWLYSSTLQNAAKTAGGTVNDVKLSTEIRGLVEKNGRIDHNASGHDDMVISWLLCHWFANNAKRLNFYGIPKNLCMSRVGIDNKKVTVEELAKRRAQKALREKIENLTKKLSETTSPFQRAALERQLKVLAKESKVDGGEVLNLDSLLETAKEEKIKQKGANRKPRDHIKLPSWWGRRTA